MNWCERFKSERLAVKKECMYVILQTKIKTICLLGRTYCTAYIDLPRIFLENVLVVNFFYVWDLGHNPKFQWPPRMGSFIVGKEDNASSSFPTIFSTIWETNLILWVTMRRIRGWGWGWGGSRNLPLQFWQKCAYQICEWDWFDIAQHLC